MNNFFFFVPSLVEVRIYSFFFASIKKIVLKTTVVVFFKLLWSPEIDSKELIPPAYALAGRSPYL
jgi:hypothetical protein